MAKNNRLKNIIQKSVEQSFKNNKLDEVKVNHFVKIFKSLNRETSIFAFQQYLRGLKREMRKHILIIESEVLLEKNEIESIEKAFSKKYQITSSENKINPNLLGGIKVQIDDMLFDSSIFSKIQQIGDVIHG